MIEKDYIMRLVQQFMAALARFLNKKESEGEEEEMKQLYETYIGDYVFFHTASLDEIMDSFQKYPENERVHRIEMLAELYYREAALKSEPIREELLRRALSLFTFVEHNSTTYSTERVEKINDISRKGPLT